MQIDVVDHVAGAKQARGIAVVIDVFRAFSVAPHAFAGGATRVLPVGEIEEALDMRKRLPGAFLVGERDDVFDGETPDKLFRTSLDFNIWTKGT